MVKTFYKKTTFGGNFELFHYDELSFSKMDIFSGITTKKAKTKQKKYK
jgi:hypothetical protein